MAFRIQTQASSFVYCGDSGYCKELEALAANADVLLHWLYRLTSETSSDYITKKSPASADIAKMATKANVAKLLFTHLRPQMDTQQCHQDIVDEARECFSGDVAIAEDLDVITLVAP